MTRSMVMSLSTWPTLGPKCAQNRQVLFLIVRWRQSIGSPVRPAIPGFRFSDLGRTEVSSLQKALLSCRLRFFTYLPPLSVFGRSRTICADSPHTFVVDHIQISH